MDVRLADLAVEPQHQGLRRPAFHRHVESKLLFLVGERIGDMLAVEVDLEAARRLADRELALAALRGMVVQGPVVELHEAVVVGQSESRVREEWREGVCKYV